jgi:hypothetical protein
MQKLVGTVGQLDTRGLTACLSGLATLRLRQGALLRELDRACAKQILRSQCYEVTLQMAAFADLGCNARGITSAVIKNEVTLIRRFRRLKPHHRINFLWARLFLCPCACGSLARAQEIVLYNLVPSHQLSVQGLVRLYQVSILRCCLPAQTVSL